MSSDDNFDVIPASKFDITKLTVSKLVTEDKDGNPTVQNKFYLNYGEKAFKLQSPAITLEYGGIPSADAPFVNQDEDRRVLTLPLTPNQDTEITRETKNENKKRINDAASMVKMLSSIDDYFQDEENIKKLFNTKNPSKYLYAYPLVKEKEIKGELKEQFKLKFKYQLPSIILKKEDGTLEEISEDEITDVDSICKYVNFLSVGKYIFRLQGWAQKNAVGKKPLEFGISVTLRSILVNENVTKVVNNNKTTFVDSDDENDEENDEENNKDEDNDDNDDNDDDDESAVNKNNESNDDSENNDDEEVENKKTEENNEEELEVIKPKRRTRKSQN